MKYRQIKTQHLSMELNFLPNMDIKQYPHAKDCFPNHMLSTKTTSS